MKILYFFLFLCVIFALLDPDPDPDPATQINADPCGSGYGSGTLVLKYWLFSLGAGGFSYSLKALHRGLKIKILHLSDFQL
jgi:hypothetical protein